LPPQGLADPGLECAYVQQRHAQVRRRVMPGQLCERVSASRDALDREVAVRPRRVLVAALVAAGVASDALAVRLDADGIGQALIYPYFTVQNSDGQNSWNTYLSVTNLTANAKALRVRFREGRAGKDIASFNLYLAPNDIWTAALFPMNQSSPSSPAV